MAIIIIGAGPAGLTAALELQACGIKNIKIIESDTQVGGISKTINYKGNRIDIGGHRFFSKSQWVMEWWRKILPIEPTEKIESLNFQYQGKTLTIQPRENNTSTNLERVMLIRKRLSRIYYDHKFFDYPLKLDLSTLRKLGLYKTITFGISYVKRRIKPVKPELSLEDFLKNRFGDLLFLQFFKEYTEKVWGVECSKISAEWGAQRIKSLSIIKALLHALKTALGLSSNIEQTSLIEHFLYPKYGPGQMWEAAAEKFISQGGKIILNSKVTKIHITEKLAVEKIDYITKDGEKFSEATKYLISTMPIKDLVIASEDYWPPSLLNIAKNLQYRDFITVGLLYSAKNFKRGLNDNWIYIQEPGVQVGRIQIFNNWSPHLVANSETVWVGLEFFCNESDEIWQKSDEDLKKLAQFEMKKIGLTTIAEAIDSVVIRIPKAYPGYFGDAYQNFESLRNGLDEVKNLFLIGRNGMHRYNNQDHSMLTAKEAALQINTGLIDKSKIWAINIGDDYHEEGINQSNEAS
jgi:protoporphyrinogen oxidase